MSSAWSRCGWIATRARSGSGSSRPEPRVTPAAAHASTARSIQVRVRRNCRLWMRTNCSIRPKSIAHKPNIDSCIDSGASASLPSLARYVKLRSRRRAGVCDVSARYQFIFACLALVALPFEAAQAQPADRAPDTMAARVLACASCHGAQGEGTSDEYFPRLAGKPAGYLYNQLVAFKDGRRRYPPMNYLLEFLPDAYLKQIAEHFASLRPPFPARAANRSPGTAIRSAAFRLALPATIRISAVWSPRSPACSACARATSRPSSA